MEYAAIGMGVSRPDSVLRKAQAVKGSGNSARSEQSIRREIAQLEQEQREVLKRMKLGTPSAASMRVYQNCEHKKRQLLRELSTRALAACK